MRQLERRLLMTAVLILVAGVAFVAGNVTNSMTASAQAQQSDSQHAQRVVDAYLSILDTGMSTPQCDFSQLSTIYTDDARVTLTGGPFAPGGPFGPGGSAGQQQFEGIQAITGFYTKLCHILYSKGAGAPSWSQDAGYELGPYVLNSYEHVSFSGHLAGRCMHVFTISGNRISSLDWAVYA